MCAKDRACYDSTCVDPCGPTFCGGGPCCNPGASCRGRDHKAECSCPPGSVGDARLGGSCAPSTRSSSTRSLCHPNPCGEGAECNVGEDNTGKPRPICTCPWVSEQQYHSHHSHHSHQCRRGYRGNALVRCRRGECFNDSECPDFKACFDYKCKDPCKGPTTSCGQNANCKVCKCLVLVQFLYLF